MSPVARIICEAVTSTMTVSMMMNSMRGVDNDSDDID